MKALPVQRRALLKRHALIQAAETLFTTTGYEATTAKRIASQAEVAIGTFYQYFDNKEQILREIAQKMRDQVYHSIPEQITVPDDKHEVTTLNVIRDVLDTIYDYHENNPELHQVLEQRRHLDPALNEILLNCEEKLEGKIRIFIRSFNIRQPDVVAYNVYAMVEGLVHRHVFGPRHTDKTQTLDLAAEMLTCYLQQQPND